MDKNLYLGIDNGLSGGLAVYDSTTNTVIAIPMPVVNISVAKGNKNEYNLISIIQFVNTYKDRIRLAILERAQVFPGQGAVSMFTVGKCFGTMEGILATMGIPYQIVAPKTWQKRIFEGIAHEDTKQASILVAQRLFPGTSFLATERSKKPHDGMTDATLMAYYGKIIN